MGALIRIHCERDDGASVVCPVPAADVVTTTRHVDDLLENIPTLVTVERIVGRLAGHGIVVGGEEALLDLAGLVNRRFIPSRPSEWEDADLRLPTSLASAPAERVALDVISELRNPTIGAASTILSVNPRDLAARRLEEVRLTDQLADVGTRRRADWIARSDLIARFLGNTVLTAMVSQLLGVPLADIIRTAVKRVFTNR